MPHIYPDKTRGWRVKYRLYFVDGATADKEKFAKRKADGMALYADVERLEALGRRRALAKDEIVYALNRGYINHDEATRLTREHIAPKKSWNQLEKAYEDWSRDNCRAYTHKCNTSRVRVLRRFFEAYDTREINIELVEKYTKVRRKKVKAATINKELNTLRRLLDTMGGDNPARKVSLLKVNDEIIPRALTADEINVFLLKVDEYQSWLYKSFKPLVFTYLFAGLRPSELVRLKVQDVNLEANKIKIQGPTKTGTARTVDIHPILRAQIEARKGPYLFGGENQINPDSVSRAIRKVMSKAGLEGVTPYSLRHTFCSYLLKSGATLKEVMDLAGHRRLSTTSRYLHTISDQNSPVQRLNFGQKGLIEGESSDK